MSTLAVLLKESWSHVEVYGDDLANHFYARLFLADPDLRDLFPVEMTAQRSRLLESLVSIIQAVDDPDRFDEYLWTLGRAHRRFHVEPAHYAIMGTALLDTLRQYAGVRWSIEYDQAWRDAYDAIATRMLRAAEQAATPAYWHAEVIGHERRGRDIAIVRCLPLHPFEYLPGQYVCVETPHQPRNWRPYSIANAPRTDGTIDLHIRAPTDGWVSAAMVRRLAVGDMLRLSPPMGSMVLNPYSDRDIVCVAGGTGLAPIKALVEELTRHNGPRFVHVFHGVRDRVELYDLAELNQLAARHSWLSVVPACSDDPTYPGEQGLISDVVERFGPWPDHDVFVCGTPGMVRAILGMLPRMGVAQTRVRYDAIPMA